jgi:hypothetical protein
VEIFEFLFEVVGRTLGLSGQWSVISGQ